MTLNQDCVRDLLLYFDEFTTRDSHGRVNKIKMRDVLQLDMFSGYQHTEIADAASYLVQKKWIIVSNPGIATPFHFIVCGLTASGQDYANTLRDNSLWKKLKSGFSGNQIISLGLPILQEFIKDLSSK